MGALYSLGLASFILILLLHQVLLVSLGMTGHEWRALSLAQKCCLGLTAARPYSKGFFRNWSRIMCCNQKYQYSLVNQWYYCLMFVVFMLLRLEEIKWYFSFIFNWWCFIWVVWGKNQRKKGEMWNKDLIKICVTFKENNEILLQKLNCVFRMFYF